MCVCGGRPRESLDMWCLVDRVAKPAPGAPCNGLPAPQPSQRRPCTTVPKKKQKQERKAKTKHWPGRRDELGALDFRVRSRALQPPAPIACPSMPLTTPRGLIAHRRLQTPPRRSPQSSTDGDGMGQRCGASDRWEKAEEARRAPSAERRRPPKASAPVAEA